MRITPWQGSGRGLSRQTRHHGPALSLVCLVALVLALLPGRAFSEIPAGTVVAVRGDVSAVLDGQIRPLGMKSPIFAKDTVKTGAFGRVQLKFRDHTLLTLGKNTQMDISRYLWRPDDPSSEMKIKVKEGSFRVMGGAITRIAPQNFTTEAPSGTIGIRGSMYAGMVEGKKLSVLFQGGKGIYISNPAGLVEISRPGFGTIVEKMGLAPEPPRRFSPKDLERFESALAVDRKGEGEEKSDQASDQATDQATGPKKGEKKPGKPLKKPPPRPHDPSFPPLTDLYETVGDATRQAMLPPGESGDEKAVLTLLGSLGFSGGRSRTLRPSGVSIYKGVVKGIDDQGTFIDRISFAVNWETRRFAAFDEHQPGGSHEKDGGSGFGFGRVGADGRLFDLHLMGSELDPRGMEPLFLTGGERFGQVYGGMNQALGLVVAGADIEIRTQVPREIFTDTLAALLDKTITPPPTGSMALGGFFTGVGEDMARPDQNRRLFMNADPGEFRLNIDPGAGVVSGVMGGKDVFNSGTRLSRIGIGGSASSSVYIMNNVLGAFLWGGSVATPGGAAGLKPHGNYLVSVDDTRLSNHTFWGYWEAAYKEPGTARDYHIHVPGSIWVAGAQTPRAVIDDLAATGFTAVYRGGAKGVRFNPLGQITELTNGKTELAFDFSPNAPVSIKGGLSFDQGVLDVAGGPGAIKDRGFRAIVSGAGQSAVSGAFFGEKAQGIGGNFSARMPDGYHYTGVFAGDR